MIFFLDLSRLSGCSADTFLLVTAALANLTFLSPLTAPAMLRSSTVGSLARAVRKGGASVFAKDQVIEKSNCKGINKVLIWCDYRW